MNQELNETRGEFNIFRFQNVKFKKFSVRKVFSLKLTKNGDR